jgi:hypothetical protein
MQTYRFTVEFIAPAAWFPKPAPAEKKRRTKGSASVSSETEKQAIDEVKHGYKRLGIKLSKISLTDISPCKQK